MVTEWDGLLGCARVDCVISEFRSYAIAVRFKYVTTLRIPRERYEITLSFYAITGDQGWYIDPPKNV